MTDLRSAEKIVSPNADGSEVKELCRLLTTFSQEELQQLQVRIENPSCRAKDVSEILAEAVRISTTKDSKLANNLAPLIERGISSSIRNSPRQFTEILAPVMGPAIRTSITNALRDYTSSVDRMLQNSLSLKGLGWRLEAMRSGKSFAEIVMYHTLEYKVEHVFLINRADGLLISHVSNADKKSEAPDAVSGMLTAIDDFVNDSFGVDSDRGLGRMQIGDLSVLICKGTKTLMAAVVRGDIPEGFRTDLMATQETFEVEYQEELKQADLDTSAFLAFDQRLLELLQIKLRYEREGKKGSAKSKVRMALLASGLALIAGYYFLNRYQDHKKWDKFFSYIEDQPGIVLVDIEAEGGFYNLKGLKDPLAVHPEELFKRQDFYDKNKLSFDFQSFQSLDDEIIEKRLGNKSNLHSGIELDVTKGGHVRLSGLASSKWLEQFKLTSAEMEGVRELDFSGLKISKKGRYEELRQSIESEYIRFSTKLTTLSTKLEYYDRIKLDRISESLNEIQILQRKYGQPFKLVLYVFYPFSKRLNMSNTIPKLYKQRIKRELVSRDVPEDFIKIGTKINQGVALDTCSRYEAACAGDQPFVYFSLER